MGDVMDAFDVDTGGARFHVEANEGGWVDVTFRPGDGPPIDQFRASIVANDDGLVLQPMTYRGAPQPDPALVEYVAGAMRERAPAWGPPRLWLDGDWREVFKYAASGVEGVEGYTGETDGFAIRDVAEVIATADGENDGASWCGAFRLRDGRFAFVEASCDYTGWG